MKDIKLYEIYFNNIVNPTILDFLCYHSYVIADTSKFKFILKLFKFIILILENIKFKNKSDKIVDVLAINLTIPSINDNNHAYSFFRTKKYDKWILELDNGYKLECADEHLVYSSINYVENWEYICNLTTNHYILTDEGYVKVKNVIKTNNKEYMCDLTIAEEDHSYFTNGILSHNTTTTAAYIAWYICFHNDRNVFVCANKGRTAVEIMNKIKEVIEGLPFFIKPGIVNLSQDRMRFENGCSIKCAAASSTPATGDSILLLYIDETALIPENIIEEYWASVIPTMSSFTNSLIIVSSTPRGKGNRFFKIVDEAIKGINDFYYLRVDWWEVPGHDEKWAEDQRKLLGDELFNREFGLSFESSNTRLTSSHAIKLFDKIKLKFIPREFYSVPDEISKNIKWASDFDPTYMSYDELKNKRFLLVVDTALGIEAGTTGKKDSDYNVINIFEIDALSPNKVEVNRDNRPITVKDCIQYKQVGLYMDNTRDEATCAEAAKYITFLILKCGYKDIDNVRVLIEINFNGNNWITKFKNHPSFYDSIILKTVRGVLQPGLTVMLMKQQYGFRTTGGSHGKAYYCELGASMMHKRLIIIRQYDENINLSSIGQLSQFGKNNRGTYMGSCCHDDISVTCLFVSIALESRQFIIWINEWLETTYLTYKIGKIRLMLNIYVEQESQMSDEMFHSFYKAASANFGKLTYSLNGYGSVMNGSNNNYGLPGNGMHSGFGNMISTRKY